LRARLGAIVGSALATEGYPTVTAGFPVRGVPKGTNSKHVYAHWTPARAEYNGMSKFSFTNLFPVDQMQRVFVSY